MLANDTVLRESVIGGLGIFATATFTKGDFLWRLDSDVIFVAKEDVHTLPAVEQSRIFQFGDRFPLVTDQSDFMNHSCDPNAWWDGDDTLIARRDIAAGEELTYDYATTETDPAYVDDWDCHCGAGICRGRISAADCLDTAFQERYGMHLPSATLRFIGTHAPSPTYATQPVS